MAPRPRLVIAFPILALLACAQTNTGPQPPCGRDPLPAYPGLDHSPAVKVWTDAGLLREWSPPPCTGWSIQPVSNLVATVGRFRNPGVDVLRRRLAAISGWKGIRYWSTTAKRWQTLIADAFALKSPEGGRRQDFSLEEVSAGRTLYFHQEDNLSGKAAYRLTIRELSPYRLVFATENVTPVRYLLLTLFEPGEVQAAYFLERESAERWRFYALARTGGGASSLLAGHEASLINRAVALYRYLAGIPTDQEPPASR